MRVEGHPILPPETVLFAGSQTGVIIENYSESFELCSVVVISCALMNGSDRVTTKIREMNRRAMQDKSKSSDGKALA